MKVRDIITIIDGKLLTGEELLELDIHAACGADLMSDVMAFVKENVMLLTGLLNPQSIRTAELMDIRVIIYVRGKIPTKEMLSEAEKNNMAIISTKCSMFVACGRLYESGIRAGGTREIE